MTTIHFTQLVCDQTQDRFGTDDAFLAFFVDGEYVGNIVRQLITGQALNLGFDLEFQDSIQIQLWEIDNPAAGNPHDFLGQIAVGVQDTSISGLFNRAGGQYRIDYTIQPNITVSPPLLLRKDEANMSAQERQRFLDGLTTLINNETYGRFVQEHAGSQGDFEFRNHFFASQFGAMRFLPWHRAYLVNLERALRAIDPTLFIPYWRWTINRDIPNWLANFTPDVPMPDGSTLAVTRNPQGWPLPTVQDVNNELANSSYSAFNNALERGSHGSVHMWVSGNMGDARIASSDVLFWLHHCEVDRIWDTWQRTHNEAPALSGNQRIMDPYPETVNQLLEIESLGYTYA